MFETLKILLWKHFIVRLRRFIHTFLDYVSPIVFFVMLFLLRHEINPTPRSHHLQNPDFLNTSHYLQEVQPLSETPKPQRILYTPDTNLTKMLMDAVGQKLGLKRLNQFPDHKVRGYYPYSNGSAIKEFIKNMRETEALVDFQDVWDGISWPEKLKYTIKMKQMFETFHYEPIDGMRVPHSYFGRMYESFMRLQWAVDTSYIQVLTGNDINVKVDLQEFPYPRSSKNEVITMLCSIFQHICWLSLMLNFVFLMTRLLEERVSGIQELVKMVGVSIQTLFLSHFLNVLPAGLLFSIIGTVLLKVESGTSAFVPNSNGFLIWLMLLLHFTSVMAIAFICSYLARSNQYAVALSMFAFILIWIPVKLLQDVNLYRPLVYLVGLYPHIPMQWFWTEVSALEQYGQGVDFTTMASSHNSQSGSVLMCYIYLLIQIALFTLIAWYLALVLPGKYGQALPWNFLCQKQYWTKNEVMPQRDDDESEEPITQDQKYFEEPPANMEVGIKIQNVSKIFNKRAALQNVNLDVYKGEITVLLGHNGAGKTTLMSIITGMISASSGKVFVNGFDTATQQREIRKLIGLCPQYNLFFSDLTILEHVMFFTLLKGSTYAEAKSSSLKLLERLGLGQKANSRAAELSGGMKRRLQLACALAGGAELLVLDEPTSGLDVETRRELWDLLLSVRGERTVLLTTHFMEEADALGDRVAALHSGKLKCHATTMYLKKAIGTGYRLTFTTIGEPNEQAITSVVTSQIPDATLKEQTLNSLSYNLPAKHNSKFPKLFNDLEKKRSELRIDSIGVGISTLEEVFLQLCSDVDTSFTEDATDGVETAPTYIKLTGPKLYVRQLCALLKRQVQYVLSKKISFLILQVILPIIMICLFTSMFNNLEPESDDDDAATAMNLDLYKPMPDKRVLYRVDVKDANVKTLTDHFTHTKFEKTGDVFGAVLRTGFHDVIDYNKYIAGVELNDTNAKVLFTTTIRHAAPVGLNLLSNILASRYIPWADGATLTTLNRPLLTHKHYRDSDDGLEEPKTIVLGTSWAMFVCFVILTTVINFVSLPCKERLTGSRHIHIMSACPPELHWSATLVFHMLVAICALILPTAIALCTLEKDSTTDQPAAVGAIVLILILGSLSFLAFMYLVSFRFGERGASTFLVAVVIVFGAVTPFLQIAYDIFRKEPGAAYILLQLCLYVMPPHTLLLAVLRTVNVARINALCNLNKDNCELITAQGFDYDKCCVQNVDPRCYFCIDDYAGGQHMLILVAQFIVYMTLVFLTQRGYLSGVYDKIFNARYQPPQHRFHDDMVQAERTYVSQAVKLPKDQIKDAMLIDDVHKNYHNICRKSCNAVKGISFSVKKGECFGLLGVNGAGKSTTFKMLTGEERPTRGNIFANGHHLTRGSSEYLRSLGYCPQFFGLDEFQTGKENLQLLLTLRGLNAEDVKTEVTTWIQVVGLEKYMNRRVSGYSGGCVRRLGTAAALCSGAAVTLLDEPTAGVDVSARRRVWAALRRGLTMKRAVLITSHSMDEMEALCSRIGIMSGGSLCALGSPAALRARHAQGHAVLIKLHAAMPHDETDSAKSELDRLKGMLHDKFNCTLKDEHKTMLHYHINETMRYSELFSLLEELKASFPGLLEDYSVTETTLEEVFLSFAKDPSEGPAAV